MQFRKTSKKTRTLAEETAATPELVSQAETSKPRPTRSSQSKSSEGSETGSVKHRKAATKPSAAEEIAAPVPALKTAAAAAGATQSAQVETSEIYLSPAQNTAPGGTARPVTHDEIATLAHSYWVARGYAHGSPEQDWLRAERELKTRR